MEEEHQNQNNMNMMVTDAAVQAAATTNVATTNTITAIPVATVATATSTTEDGEGKNNTAAAGGFIVHTKHTCDKCFKAPIIGKRYISTTKPNFDLCGDCASKYDGEDSIGLEETVLARDKKRTQEFVLKLKIDHKGEVQTRRIKLSELWARKNQQLKFKKLMEFAAVFVFQDNSNKAESDAKRNAFVANAKATYVDDDGDLITMSSNKELEDAFIQVLKKVPGVHKPFIVNVTFKDVEPAKRKEAPGKAAGMPKRIQLRKLDPTTKKVVAMSKDKSPLPGVPPKKFEKKFFIHARHTCDGCSKSPIIGTRYKAKKIQDFDLCGNCFAKYEGDKADFEPAVLDRDRRMQQRWIKKQLVCPFASRSTGTWKCAKGGESLASFLKKIQEETGAVIESATVLHGSPHCEGYDEKVPSAEDDDAKPEPMEEEVESVKVEPAEKKPPESPTPSKDESFLEDADGSIAEAIGRTLDVCVAAIEGAMDEVEKVDAAGSKGEQAPQKSAEDVAASVAADAFSVASSIVSGMTDMIKKMEDTKMADVSYVEAGSQSNNVPSVVSGTTIVKSEEGTVKEEGETELPKVEDVEDEWSVVDDEEGKPREEEEEEEKKRRAHELACIQATDDFGRAVALELERREAVSAVSALSPVVLAKWDTELHQMHELGFLDDRKNVDALEHLEASHMGCDSTDKVTVNEAIEYLLK